MTPEPRLRELARQRALEMCRALGVRPARPDLYCQALAHSSWTNEHPEAGIAPNERLEFLGDAVWQLAVSEYLFHHLPEAPEGELTRRRAALVREETLAELARQLRLGHWALLGKGEEESGGRERPSLLADLFEAVLGSVYLDHGLAGVAELIQQWGERFGLLELSARSFDHKSKLHEYWQARGEGDISYHVVSVSGPDHQPVFVVEVRAGGRPLGRGTGKTKKDAEQAAARRALARLQRPDQG